jgi:DNA-binding Lrp family transcriptional regulator
MTDAFVHLVVEPGEITAVARELRTIDGVSRVALVTGEFDIIAQLDYGGLSVDTHQVLQEELDVEPREKLPEQSVAAIEELDHVESAALNLAYEP